MEDGNTPQQIVMSAITAADNYMLRNGRWMSLLTASVILSTVIAFLSVMGSPNTHSYIGATIAALTVLASNAATYYNTVKTRLDQAEHCKSSLLRILIELQFGTNIKNVFPKQYMDVLDKYPQVLASTQAPADTTEATDPPHVDNR